MRAIVEAIDQALHSRGCQLHRREGFEQCRWVLLDYGEVVVHVQHEEDREFYALERLWADAPLIEVPEAVEVAEVTDAADAARVEDAGVADA